MTSQGNDKFTSIIPCWREGTDSTGAYLKSGHQNTPFCSSGLAGPSGLPEKELAGSPCLGLSLMADGALVRSVHSAIRSNPTAASAREGPGQAGKERARTSPANQLKLEGQSLLPSVGPGWHR